MLTVVVSQVWVPPKRSAKFEGVFGRECVGQLAPNEGSEVLVLLLFRMIGLVAFYAVV